MKDPSKLSKEMEASQEARSKTNSIHLEDRLNSSNLWALAQMVERQKSLMAENLKK